MDSKKEWNGVHHKNSHLTDADYCVRCGKKVKASEEPKSLELNSHTGEYRDDTLAVFPEVESQGWFTFGATCAARTLEEQRQRHLAAMRVRIAKAKLAK